MDVRFRETMTGLMTVGEHDPRAGYLHEGASGVVLRAAVEIDDIATFIDDPAHGARLHGVFDVPRLGGMHISGRGRFELFSADRMLYELPVLVDGRAHLLRGVKHVDRAPMWRAWRATTTLLTTLHDEAGTVVAAGVLRIGPLALARMVFGMAGAGRVRFLAFFTGRLIATYGRLR